MNIVLYNKKETTSLFERDVLKEPKYEFLNQITIKRL